MTTATRRGAALRVARLVPLTELSRLGRVPSELAMTGVQVLLYYWLWTAVYAAQSTDTVAGVDVRQVVTYSALAILCSRIRWTARTYNPDAVPMRIREGSIVYWFVRPLSARRFHAVRAAGEMAFGGAVALVCGLACVAFGLADPPASAAVAAVFVVSTVLGQIIGYQLALVVDLICFWLLTNDSVRHIYTFVQDLLSGVFVPVWFFPAWLGALAVVLPFQYTIAVPLSIYIGRTPLSDATGQIGLQLAWCAGLTLLTRVLWWRAGLRVAAQGG